MSVPAPTVTVNRPMTSTEWVLLLALSALWGGSFVFTGMALAELPPLTLVALRVGLAAMVLHLAVAALGLPLPRGRAVWLAFAGMGLRNNAIPFCLIAWSQTEIPSGLAAILNATTPLATVIVAHHLTADEKATGHRMFGVLAGLIGVAVMIGPDALTGLGSRVMAQLAVLAAALSYAFAAVYGRRFARLGIAPVLSATGQLTASAAMLLPLALIVDRPWTLAMPSLATTGAVLGLATLCTAVSYLLYFRILLTAGATNLLLVTFLIPVSANVLAVLVLGERLAPISAVGMALIAAGLAAIDGRLLRLGRSADGCAGTLPRGNKH
jgi:drug/metabolite transporter (DMT)-like permease